MNMYDEVALCLHAGMNVDCLSDEDVIKFAYERFF